MSATYAAMFSSQLRSTPLCLSMLLSVPFGIHTDTHYCKRQRLSDPVQMLVVAVAKLPLAQRAPLPGLKVRGDVREEAETVIGGHDRHTDHVAERDEHEERFHGGADLERLLRVLVAKPVSYT